MTTRMEIPKIGDVFYGIQHEQDRIGQLNFLCETQEHVRKNPFTAKEAIDEIDADEDIRDEVIVWQLTRIA